MSAHKEKSNPDRNSYTVILIGDDGKAYKLGQSDWQVEKYRLPNDAPILPKIIDAKTFGTELANIPDVGPGIGEICVFVNVQAIVK